MFQSKTLQRLAAIFVWLILVLILGYTGYTVSVLAQLFFHQQF